MNQRSSRTPAELTLSVLIPVYNAAPFLCATLESVLPQLAGLAAEVILVDDGSTDGSGELAAEWAARDRRIRLLRQENRGAAAARNAGLGAARGTYVLFLDADDRLAPGSVPALVDFFQEHREEVDLITYPIETWYRGKRLPPHFRYSFLRESGVYDLRLHPYIGQTTMNIMVRNRFSRNVLFQPGLRLQEDQDYCCRVLEDKLRIGYCSGAKYLYNRRDESSSGLLAGACFAFGDSTRFFEELFGRYPAVPLAFQGLYITDLDWKNRQDMLFPYHQNQAELPLSVSRLARLLNRVDNGVILGHPAMDPYHKWFFLSLKTRNRPVFFQEGESFGLRCGTAEVLRNSGVELVLTRMQVMGKIGRIWGILRSPVFDFTPRPTLLALEGGEGGTREREIPLSPSSYGYHLCHTRTNRFWGFCWEWDAGASTTVDFVVEMEKRRYPTAFCCMPWFPLQHAARRRKAVYKGVAVQWREERLELAPAGRGERSRRILQGLPTAFATGGASCAGTRLQAALAPPRRIWLYCDCRNVLKDNGYEQFQADDKLDDGVTRYYVVPGDGLDRSGLFHGTQRDRLVPFGSRTHRKLALQCQRILTAFIEEDNLFPFSPKEIPFLSDLPRCEVVYLQHGILHAKVPWKYTPERLLADRIVVSSQFEWEVFQRNGYRREDFIPVGMPRLHRLDRSKPPEKRLLLALSWRKYLIGWEPEMGWIAQPEKFISSDYYQKTRAFLSSPQLERLLEETGYALNVKLHPIFQSYRELFDGVSRVKILDDADPIEQYAGLITDISSYCFDFVYLERPVLYFLPDRDPFYTGMNEYRELELPLEEGFGPIAYEPGELVSHLETLLRNGCRSAPRHARRIREFFRPEQRSGEVVPFSGDGEKR